MTLNRLSPKVMIMWGVYKTRCSLVSSSVFTHSFTSRHLLFLNCFFFLICDLKCGSGMFYILNFKLWHIQLILVFVMFRKRSFMVLCVAVLLPCWWATAMADGNSTASNATKSNVNGTLFSGRLSSVNVSSISSILKASRARNNHTLTSLHPKVSLYLSIPN